MGQTWRAARRTTLKNTTWRDGRSLSANMTMDGPCLDHDIDMQCQHEHDMKMAIHLNTDLRAY
jgi:hypothetical protein